MTREDGRVGALIAPVGLLFSLLMGLICGTLVYFDHTIAARIICFVLALSGIPGYLVYTRMGVNTRWTQALFELNRMTALATAFYSLVFLNLIIAQVNIAPYSLWGASNYVLFGAYSGSHFANYFGLYLLWRRKHLWLWVLKFPGWLWPGTLLDPGVPPPKVISAERHEE